MSAAGDVVRVDCRVAAGAGAAFTAPSGATPEAGTYYWVASYSGDANNAPAASGCEDEPVTVNNPTPARLTTRHTPSATAGSSFKDKATISGLAGAKPGGQITWKLYDNKECKSAEGGVVSSDGDRKSTRLNSSHSQISYAVFCLKKKKKKKERR